MIKLNAKQIATVINRARTQPAPPDGIVGDLREATLNVISTRFGALFATLASTGKNVELFDLDEFLKNCGMER